MVFIKEKFVSSKRKYKCCVYVVFRVVCLLCERREASDIPLLIEGQSDNDDGENQSRETVDDKTVRRKDVIDAWLVTK